MNWLDLVLIIIIALSAIKGLSSGFIAGVSRLAGLILGILTAFYGYRSLAVFIDRQWGWENIISEFIINNLSSSSYEELFKIVNVFGFQNNSSNNQLMYEGLNNIADQLAVRVLEFVSFIIILLSVSLLVKIVMSFFSNSMDHTFLSPLDHFGGLLLGLVRGVIIVLVIAFLLEPFAVTGVLAGQEQTGLIVRAVNRSQIIPYAWQTLNLIKLYLPL